MNKEKVLRFALALFSSVSVFLICVFLSFLLMEKALGGIAYAANTPWLIPLGLLASLLCFSLFYTKKASMDEEYEAEEEAEFETEYTREDIADYGTEFDSEIYPEFKKSEEIPEAEEENLFSRPDIKKLIGEQKGEAPDGDEPTKAPPSDWEKELYGEKNEAPRSASYELMADLPTELPEDYVPYEEEQENEEEEEEYYSREIPPLAIRLPLALIAVVLAIFIPVNTATVYTPDKIIKRNIFQVSEYTLTAATNYTVGVKLNGDVSLKLHFPDGESFEANYNSIFFTNDKFNANFASSYGYAAFCDRLLQKHGVSKNFDDLRSLDIPLSISDKDYEHVYEITDGACEK